MASPEFRLKLDWPSAQNYRRQEASVLRTVRNSGLAHEAREYRDLLHQDPLYQAAKTLTMQHRWENLAQNTPEFSEEDWEKAGRVLSGINNGVKAALFVDIAQGTNPGTYLPVENIVDNFKRMFAGTKLLEAFGKNTKSQVILYCQQSLCDVGVLTAEYNLAGELIGFGVTEDGLALGLPHALRVLQWENKEHAKNESVHSILGQTNSPGETRAPYKTARMLEYLYRHPYNVREADLIEILGMNHINFEHALLRVDQDHLGLVHHIRRQIEYVQDENKSLEQAGYITTNYRLRYAVISVIQQKGLGEKHSRFSVADIFEVLPQEIRKNRSERSLKSNISKILGTLARGGFLQRAGDFKENEKQSDISLTQKGRAFVVGIILPVLLNTPTQSLTASISQLAQNSAELYYPHSRSHKKREQKNNSRKILEAILEKPQTARELAVKLNLPHTYISDALRPHIKDSSEVIKEIDGQTVIVEREKINGVWHYSLKNPESV